MLKRLVFSWLDFKVGFRMLARYPGLTIVGTVAIAIAIALGSIYFEGLHKWENPLLPSTEADRIVSIRNWDVDALSTESRSLYDFMMWRDQAKTIEVGAAVSFVRNLATDDGRVETVVGADITPNAFGMLGTPAKMGRMLTDRDAQPSEPPVLVISYSLWKTRFDSDPRVVGRTVRIGTAIATIVGVMPEGFGFPVSQRVWAPLRIQGLSIAPRSGPVVSIFGRLAQGKPIADAQSELSVIGARIAATNPATHQHLKPRVTAYAQPLAESGQALTIRRVLYSVNIVFLMLLSVICANVATLVFARTATRSWEITVRTALGASRGRIISQLFIEALVLSGIAAVVGLLLAKFAMRWALDLIGPGGTLPYWINDGLSWKTVLYAAALTLFGAAIVGILPALRVTRVNVQDALRSESAAGSGLRFGGFWTTIIVVQIAITVAFLPLAAGGSFESNRFRQRADGIGAQRYLSASVDVDREQYGLDSSAFAARARLRFDELERRVAAEPGVERVTFADRLPVQDQFKYQIDIDTATGGPTTGLRRSALVQASRGFFNAFGTSVISGRDFTPADYDNGRVLIVNESFVRNVLGGRNPIGQRIRVVAGEDMSVASKEWYEIIGTVKNFGWQADEPQEVSSMYRPHLPLPGTRVGMAIRVRDPETFGPRLRALALEVDPTIRLTDVQSLKDIGGGEAKINWALTSVLWLVSFIVLLLSATGIHSLMSFTVSRRTREIGIRTALGASPRRIVGGIFSRAFLQMSAGLVVGTGLAALLGLSSARDVMLVLGADTLMLVVGLTACAVPLRRALRIDPTEALRSEG